MHLNNKKKSSLGLVQKVIVVILALILMINLYFLVMQLVFKVELPKVLGFGQVIVISGSMEPSISAGDMLIIKNQSAYQIGDVVTYQWGNSLCTHRIVEIDGNTMITKGDANNVADEPTSMSLIEGKVVFKIPTLGNLVLFLKTPIGIGITAVVALVLLEASNFIERFTK